MTHPWFTKKLPPQYDAALQDLRADQGAMDRAFVQASLDVKKRDEDLHVRVCTLLRSSTVCSCSLLQTLYAQGL